jgi:hypothetical protein
VLAGLVLSELEPDDPSLEDALLVCATEVTTPDEIALFAWALGEELGAGGAALAGTEAGRPVVAAAPGGRQPRSVDAGGTGR